MKNFLKKYGVLSFYILTAVYCFILFSLQLPKYQSMLGGFLFVFVVDYYVWLKLRQLILSIKKKWLKWGIVFFYFLPLVLLFIFLGVLSVAHLSLWSPVARTYLLGIPVIFFIPKLLMACFYLLSDIAPITKIRLGTGFIKHIHYWAISVGLICLLILIHASIFTVFNFKLKTETLKSSKIPPAFNDYRIVQFSDMHIGSFVKHGSIEKLCAEIMEAKPDLIVFTGDMVNFSTKELLPYHTIFAKLKAKDGIYCVKGNHDYASYVTWKKPQDSLQSIHQMDCFYASLGWKCLNNEGVNIIHGRDTIALVGVENWGKGERFPKLGNIDTAIKQIAPNLYTILLSHDPSYFDSVIYKQYPQIDLTLSGHTHGMQMGVRIGEKEYSPAQYLYPHFSGMYPQENGQKLYVSTGCGFNGFPFRVGVRPSVTLFILKTR
ncbi:MAG: metallophosphoesterase [Bacteroidales bacterium]